MSAPAMKRGPILSLDPALIPRLKAQAKRLRCKESSLCSVLLLRGLEQLEQSTDLQRGNP